MIERDSVRFDARRDANKQKASDTEELLVEARRELVKKDAELLRLGMLVSSLQEEASKLEKEVAWLRLSQTRETASKPAPSLEREALDLRKLLAKVKQERDDLLLEKEKGYIYGLRDKPPAAKSHADFEGVAAEGGVNQVYRQDRHSHAKLGLRDSSYLNESIDFGSPDSKAN